MDDRRVAVVVEDDDDIRDLLVALLGQSGFEVHSADNGSDGVKAVQDHDPVLVTVDLGLPGIDGYEVTRRIRRSTDAYVVMLTARDEEIDTLIGLDAGADDYLTKPFRPRELRARVEAMLRRPRAASVASPVASPTSPSASPSVSAAVPTPAPDRAQPAPDLPHSAPGVSHPGSAPRGPAKGLSGAAGRDSAPPSGTAASGAASLELNGLVMYPAMHQVASGDREVPLTVTEFVLLETLLRSGRVVRSKAQLSRILRGDDPDAGTFVSEADERSVEVHVGNMRRKLRDNPREPRWIETVRGIGYRATGSSRVSA